MRAVVARAGTVGVEEVADPVPGPGQVVVAPLACGICGTDLHLVESQAAMPELVPPIVLGHEFVGEVIDHGPDTDDRLPRGSVVSSVPWLDTAAGPQLIGLTPAASGGLAERMLLQGDRLVAIPDGVRAEQAALTEPLAVGVHAVAAARMQPDDVALVVGCGPVGLAVIASLKAAGHGPVIASDFSPARRGIAERFGADVVVDPASASPYEKWADFAGPPLPSSPLIETSQQPNTVVFECVGIPGILQTVINSVVPHTRIIVVGVCMQPDTITPAAATTKEVSVTFVFAYRPDEFTQALRWIADGTVDAGAFVSAVRSFEDAPDAFAQLRRPDEHCKILLTPGGSQ